MYEGKMVPSTNKNEHTMANWKPNLLGDNSGLENPKLLGGQGETPPASWGDPQKDVFRWHWGRRDDDFDDRRTRREGASENWFVNNTYGDRSKGPCKEF